MQKLLNFQHWNNPWFSAFLKAKIVKYTLKILTYTLKVPFKLYVDKV